MSYLCANEFPCPYCPKDSIRHIKYFQMRFKQLPILLIFMLGYALCANGQHAAIKSNIIDDAFANINLGVEIGLAPKWTLDVPASYNSWEQYGGKRWKHWWVQPGARYWFCDRFGGHFIGIHAHGGQYNIGGFDGKVKFLGWHDGKYTGTDLRKLDDTRYQGWFVGGGISYGYAWMLGTHWNLEAEIGIGYSYTRYDQFRCTGCGKKIAEDQPHHYVGPTKAAINLVYLF